MALICTVYRPFVGIEDAGMSNSTVLYPAAMPSTTHPDVVPPRTSATSQPATGNSSPPRRTAASTALSQYSVHVSDMAVFFLARSSASAVWLPAASATFAARRAARNPKVVRSLMVVFSSYG